MAKPVSRVFLHDGCVIGSLHQGSHIFTGPGRGLQCVANTLCSLINSTQQPPDTWTTSDIDNILHTEDVLYTQIGKLARLLPSDIPPYICVHSVNYKISEKQSYIGSFTQVKEEFHIKTLESLEDILKQQTHFLTCIGDSAISIIHMPNSKYYIGDLHSRNISGFPVPDGTTVILTYHSLQVMNHYMKILPIHVKADTFELTPIQITCNVSQSDMMKGFNQRECKMYINMFQRAMNDPMSGLMNVYFHEEIEKGNKHKPQLPITETVSFQDNDKKKKHVLQKQ